MAGLKSLAKDTAIYGLSSIVGRFLNYMLVPLYTAVLPASTGGYGVVSNVYAFTALMLVLLTFGMETGFFRFANKSGEDPMKVYANSLLSVGGVSLIFVLLCLLFLQPISNLLDYGDHPEFIAMMAVVVALDSFQCIPFAYLRYKKRPVKFAAIKLLSIIGGIGLNLFFLLVCPWLNVHCPATISWFYDPDYLVGYIFISNLIISVVQMFFFIPVYTASLFKYFRCRTQLRFLPDQTFLRNRFHTSIQNSIHGFQNQISPQIHQLIMYYFHIIRISNRNAHLLDNLTGIYLMFQEKSRNTSFRISVYHRPIYRSSSSILR